MSRTGAQLLVGLSDFLDDQFASSTTSAGNAGGTTLVDTALSAFGDNRLVGQYAYLTATPFATRRITSNTQATGTVTVSPAFASQVGSATTYQIHKYSPTKKFLALDKARLTVSDYLFIINRDDSITGNGRSRVFGVPSSMQLGPTMAMIESPIEASSSWNFLQSPLNDSLTGWTASSLTASVHDRDSNDLFIPKYDASCTKLVIAASTAATYRQTVANMTNSITATLAASRRMTAGAWVYCTEVSRVSISILDDSGTVISSGGDVGDNTHNGNGWQLISIEGLIAGNNTTTLTFSIDIASGSTAITVFVNRCWFYFGEREFITEAIYMQERSVSVQRNDGDQTVTLSTVPPRGYQVRLMGKTFLTELGTTAATQVTNSMEVDARAAEILFAAAAEQLLAWEGIKTDNVPAVAARIANVRQRVPGLRAPKHMTVKPHLLSPFAR